MTSLNKESPVNSQEGESTETTQVASSLSASSQDRQYTVILAECDRVLQKHQKGKFTKIKVIQEMFEHLQLTPAVDNLKSTMPLQSLLHHLIVKSLKRSLQEKEKELWPIGIGC